MPSPNSQALIRKPSDTELMPPPPPSKRIKRPPKVLDEDEYTDALSHIIARDFFPGLLETQVQQDYLDALESKDKEWIASAGRKLSDIMTPGSQRRHTSLMTPRASMNATNTSMGTPTPRRIPQRPGETPKGWEGDTPMSTTSMADSTFSTASRDGEKLNVHNMGLSAFQDKYTSEDNESFYKVLDKQNTKKREKYGWLWSGNKIPSSRQIMHEKREAKMLESQAAPAGSREKQLITIDSSNNNKTVSKTNSSGKPSFSSATSLTSDQRPARPEGWKSRPENPLMFLPSSVEDSFETVQQKAEATSRAAEKRVLYHNTRVQPHGTGSSEEKGDQSTRPSVPPPSPSLSAIRDAIAGRPRPTDSEPGYTGGETPRVNGYAFVDEDEPQPTAATNEEDYHLSLFSSQSTDSTPNPFKLRENRKRELLHHRMVERVAKNKRSEKVANETKTPVPLFPSSPMIAFGKTPTSAGAAAGSYSPAGASKKALTPAAQRLWAQVGNSTPRRMDSGRSGLKNMWTPTPKRAK